jgi:hypothetical protein
MDGNRAVDYNNPSVLWHRGIKALITHFPGGEQAKALARQGVTCKMRIPVSG